MLGRGLAIAAGYLMAPQLSAMIPFELPGGKIGQYVKQFIVVSVGAQIANKALGRKYGNALLAGGVIQIGVDMLQTYVSPFGAGAGGNGGVGYYFPPNDQLALTYGGTVPGLPAETFQSGDVARLASRFS